ncbi:hypothetical protein [Paracoccus sanguinis]|uniref:Uncharacterized protein n=1 Tax=Paracoccus sanguinis TaxID=1545044 RepID=A0A099GK80_9RHOB|nr:hypothetical protein [Paracoccus sanguinis]KGJ21037.1 hypothetical protein IX55_03705 [Paracoccus sanguinis]KGJ23260.1 hypothetical protein IX56_03090 [Paracoccus sanguinis]
MERSSSAKWFWHELDRILRPALQGGASWNEAISALRDKADQLERNRDAGLVAASYRKFERL